jgi:hypothetical protein
MKAFALATIVSIGLAGTSLAGGQNPGSRTYGAGVDPTKRQANVACASELQTLCAKPVGDQAKVRCLKSNMSSVSATCAAVLR